MAVSKALRSGKLTGEEVGKLMIKDLVTHFLNFQKEENKGLLSVEERKALVDSIKKPNDIRAYNDYKLLHDFLEKEALKYSIFIQEIRLRYFIMMNFLTNFRYAEQEYNHLRELPKIVTQAEYDEIIKKEIEEKLTWKISVEWLIFDALEYFINLHDNEMVTPFDIHFNSAKKEQITNSRLLSWEWAELTDAHTKYDVLDGDFYFSAETDSEETLWEFREDYPELFNSLLSYLTELPGLEFIKEIAESEYHNTDLIPYQTLYENKILNYPDDIENHHVIDKYPAGIAILSEKVSSIFYSKDHVPYWREVYMAESFLERKDTFKHNLDAFKWNLREALISKEVVQIFSELTNLTEINLLLKPEIDKEYYQTINKFFETIPQNIHRYGYYSNERDDADLKQELKEIFTIINIEEIEPSKEAKEAARAIINFDILRGKEELLYDTLRGE